MKKCFYFPKWEEVSQFYVSNNEQSIMMRNKIYRLDAFCEISILNETRDYVLNQLLRLTGAKMYGEYVVLDSNQDISFYDIESIIKEILSFKDLISSEEYDHSNYQQDLTNIFLKYDNQDIVKLSWYPYSTINYAIKHFKKEQLKTYLVKEEYNISLLRKKVCGINSLREHKISTLNLLQELSKYYRGEENKLEEIAKKLEIKL